MAKNKKAAAGSASILSFFPRLSQPSSSQPSPLQPAPATKQKAPHQEVISVSSSSHISVSSGSKSVITVSSNTSSSFDPMESISSRNVTRNYNVAPHSSTDKASAAKRSATSQSSSKRKAKVDDSEEIDAIDIAAYIPKSAPCTRASSSKPQPIFDKENRTDQLPKAAPTRKKQRLSSPEPRLPSPEPPIAFSDPGEFIPSSQSDEDELLLPMATGHSASVMEDVDRWRNDAHSPISLPASEPFSDMDVDADLAAPEPRVTVNEPTPPAFTPASSPEPQQQPLQLTPQQPRTASLPATPVALTEASKAAQIIADIKARAYAEAVSSPEDEPRALRELDDSSDDEDLLAGVSLKRDPFAFSPVPLPRYSLRDRGTQGDTSRSESPSPPYRSKAPPVPAPPPKKADPFAALLREKKTADKHGKGNLAFRRAEAAIRSSSPLTEGSDAEGHEDWTDEVAARAAVNTWASGSGTNNSYSEEVSLNNEDQCRLLGEKRGKAVVGILDSDRAMREAAEGKQKVFGLPLWDSDSTSMETDPQIPSLLLEHTRGSPMLGLLKTSIDNGDLPRAILLLNSGLFAGLTLSEPAVAYLCDLALSAQNTSLTTPVFHALSGIWNSPSVPGLPFSVVHSALYRLGAKQDVLDSMQWISVPSMNREFVQPDQRNDTLYRLVRLVTLSTQFSRPPPSDVPDIVMALLLVGMDSSSSSDLRREITVAVDLVCRSLASPSDVSAALESILCNKLIKFLSGLEPSNKSNCIALLAGGSGRAARIARWVAHAVVTMSATVSEADYSDLPPLVSILDALAPVVDDQESESRGLFELYEDTDYVDLVFYVRILAVALSNVEGYVQEQARQPVGMPSSPTKSSIDKPDTMLTIVRHAVESLHGSIVDTRAAHLERSRAKAALKQLSMRLYYQQEAALKSCRSGKKSRPIQQYFSKAQ